MKNWKEMTREEKIDYMTAMVERMPKGKSIDTNVIVRHDDSGSGYWVGEIVRRPKGYWSDENSFAPKTRGTTYATAKEAATAYIDGTWTQKTETK